MTFNPGDKVRHRLMGWTGTVMSYSPVSGCYTVHGSTGLPVEVPGDWLELIPPASHVSGELAVFLFCFAVAFIVGCAILRGGH